jgi:hypothetical protein
LTSKSYTELRQEIAEAFGLPNTRFSTKDLRSTLRIRRSSGGTHFTDNIDATSMLRDPGTSSHE